MFELEFEASSLTEWRMCTPVKDIFSECIVSSFAYLIGFYSHLL